MTKRIDAAQSPGPEAPKDQDKSPNLGKERAKENGLPIGSATSSDGLVHETDPSLLVMAEEGADDGAGVKQSEPVSEVGRRLAIFLMVGAVLSKGLGFVREIGMAQLFGAALVADAFRAALTGAMMPFVLLQNESVPVALIPLYRDWRETGEAPKRFAALIVALSLISFAITCVILALGSLWVSAFVGGFSQEARDLTQTFISIMVMGMPASVLINALSAAEIATGRSRMTTVRASILNVAVIGGICVIMTTGELMALPFSFVIAFTSLAVYGLVTLIRDGTLDFSGLQWRAVTSSGYEFWIRVRPVLATPFAEQGSAWLERSIASRLTEGAIASLDYARTITDCAVLLIAQPLGLVLLARAPVDDERARIDQWTRVLLAFSLPGSAWLMVFGPDLARLVFSRGAFNEFAVQLTGQALRGLSIGLWATMTGWIFMRMLNSAGRNKRATTVLLAAYLCNIVMVFILYQIPALKAMGPFLIGLGESIRGLTLLAGTAIAFQAGGCVARLAAMTLPSVIFMLATGFYIESHAANLYVKVSLGGISCIASIALALAILRPVLVTRAFGELSKALKARVIGS